jgi:hypothetical protein
MDDVLYGNSCTDSAPPCIKEHNSNAVQLEKTALLNVDNLSHDAHVVSSAIINKYSTSEPLAVDVDREVGGLGAGVISKLENGRNLSGMRNYRDQVGKKLRVHQHGQENCFQGDLFGHGENFDPILGFQKTQIRNCSVGGVCTPQDQVYVNGAVCTQLFSDYISSNECVQNTQVPMCERVALTELSYEHTLEAFSKLNVGRAIRGSAVGPNTVPSTSSVRTVLPFTGNQSFYFQEFLHPPKFDKNSVPFIVRGGVNMWAGGNQALLFGRCMPSMRDDSVAHNTVAKMCDSSSLGGEHNTTIRPKCVPTSDSGTILFVNNIRTDNSLSSVGGKQEILPASEVGSILSANSGLIHNFNRAPGGPIYY